MVREHHDRLLQQLAHQFDVDRSAVQRQLSLGMRVASLLGALAFSIAVFLFFYRFWGALSVTVQVVLLIAAPILAGVGVEVAARRERTLYFASLLAVVAFASFVLDLNVVGSIFNLRPSHGAFLAWGLFALVFAYRYRLRLQLLLAIACLGIWVAGSITSLAGWYWDAMLMRPENFITAGGLSLLMAMLHSRRGEAGFALVYRFAGWVAVLVPIFLLSEWGEMSYLPLSPLAARHFYDVVGFGLGALIVYVAIRRRWPESLNVGGLFLGLFLVLKLHDWCWDRLPRYAFFLLVGGVAVGVLAALQRMRGRATAV